MKILKEKLAKIKSNNNCMDIVIENLEKLLTIGYKKIREYRDSTMEKKRCLENYTLFFKTWDSFPFYHKYLSLANEKNESIKI